MKSRKVVPYYPPPLGKELFKSKGPYKSGRYPWGVVRDVFSYFKTKFEKFFVYRGIALRSGAFPKQGA
jgi:hypothetical protein